jgi:hypothetical protein
MAKYGARESGSDKVTLEWHLRLKQSGGAHPELHEHVLRPTHVPPPLKMLQSPTSVQVAMTKKFQRKFYCHSDVTYGYYNLHLSSQRYSYNGREHHTRHVRSSYLIGGNQLKKEAVQCNSRVKNIY